MENTLRCLVLLDFVVEYLIVDPVAFICVLSIEMADEQAAGVHCTARHDFFISHPFGALFFFLSNKHLIVIHTKLVY